MRSRVGAPVCTLRGPTLIRAIGRAPACTGRPSEPFAAKDVDEALTQYVARTEQMRSAAAATVEQNLKALQRRVREAF